MIRQFTFFLREAINGSLSILPLDSSIKSFERIIFHHKVILKDVQHLDHLAENEYLEG